MRKWSGICVLAIAVGAIAAPLAAQGKGRGASSARGPKESDEVRIIRAYFANTTGLPPGLAKREKLPPGLEKQIQRKGTLPPGLEKRMIPVPVELVRQLPPLPQGQERVIVGEAVLVIDRGAQKILTSISIVARPEP